jgi:hypothetical protein
MKERKSLINILYPQEINNIVIEFQKSDMIVDMLPAADEILDRREFSS